MKIHAANRLLASSTQVQLQNFANSLSKPQQDYLFRDFPNQLQGWVGGEFTGRTVQHDESLVIAASRSLDSFILALSYLRKIYPIQMPRSLYRVYATKTLPTKSTVTINKATELKPILSFTSNSVPLIQDRPKPNKGVDIVLEWQNPKADQILASYVTLRLLVTDLSAIIPKAYGSSNNFCMLRTELNYYSPEKEYLVYLSKPITCEWSKFSGEYADEDE